MAMASSGPKPRWKQAVFRIVAVGQPTTLVAERKSSGIGTICGCTISVPLSAVIVTSVIFLGKGVLFIEYFIADIFGATGHDPNESGPMIAGRRL